MIRETRESDLEEVFNLIHAAFGNRSESDLVKQLISDGDVMINLLVELSDTIIGNVIVSKITMKPDMGLLCGGIAPVSVLPDQQSSGVGCRVVTAAIKESKKIGIDALFLFGDPNYDQRFCLSHIHI